MKDLIDKAWKCLQDNGWEKVHFYPEGYYFQFRRYTLIIERYYPKSGNTREVFMKFTTCLILYARDKYDMPLKGMECRYIRKGDIFNHYHKKKHDKD